MAAGERMEAISQTRVANYQGVLNLEGDGFLEFNPDDLEEVAIVPYCSFIQGQLPPNLEESKYYPQDFTGNPKDWFSSETVIIYQG